MRFRASLRTCGDASPQDARDPQGETNGRNISGSAQCSVARKRSSSGASHPLQDYRTCTVRQSGTKPQRPTQHISWSARRRTSGTDTIPESSMSLWETLRRSVSQRLIELSGTVSVLEVALREDVEDGGLRCSQGQSISFSACSPCLIRYGSCRPLPPGSLARTAAAGKNSAYVKWQCLRSAPNARSFLASRASLRNAGHKNHLREDWLALQPVYIRQLADRIGKHFGGVFADCPQVSEVCSRST